MTTKQNFFQRINLFAGGQTKSVAAINGGHDPITQVLKMGDAALVPTATLFNEASWYFGCMIRRAGAASSIPITFTKGRSKVATKSAGLPFRFDVVATLFKICLDWDDSGISYLMGIANRSGSIGSIQHVTQHNITPYRVHMSGGHYTRYLGDGGGNQIFTKNEKGNWVCRHGRDVLVLIPLQSPSHQVEDGSGLPGISAGRVAGVDANVLRFINVFLNDHFGSGSLNNVVASAKGDKRVSKDEVKTLRRFLNHALRGFRGRKRIEVINDISFQTVPSDIRNLSIPEISEQMQEAICVAFSTPRAIVLGDMTNRGDDDNLIKSWISHTILPLIGFVIDEVNPSLKRLTGYHMKENHKQMAVFQSDVNRLIEAFEKAVRGGMHPETAAAIVGIEIPEGYTLDGGVIGDERDEQADPDTAPDDISPDLLQQIKDLLDDRLRGIGGLIQDVADRQNPTKSTDMSTTRARIPTVQAIPYTQALGIVTTASSTEGSNAAVVTIRLPQAQDEVKSLLNWANKRVKSGKSFLADEFAPDHLGPADVKSILASRFWRMATKAAVIETGDDAADVALREFESESEELHLLLQNGEIDIDEHKEKFDSIIEMVLAKMFIAGVGNATLAAEREAIIREIINQQQSYTDGIQKDLVDGRYDIEGKTAEENRESLMKRIAQWSIVLASAYALGQINGDDSRMLEWVYDDLANHCGDCPKLHGQQRTAKEWESAGLYPGCRKLTCGSYCRCRFRVVEG